MPQARYELRDTIKSWPEGDRPREKLKFRGAAFLSDTELLAIIIGSGTGKRNALDLARDLVRRFDSLAGVEAATVEELCSLRGIGETKAVALKAALETGRRFAASSTPAAGETIGCADDVYRLCAGMMKNVKKEMFLTLLLNTRNRLIKLVKVSEGALTGTVVHPREVFNPAVRASAHGVALAHNHPSGDPEPSGDDIELTRRLVEAGRLMGIQVVDHLIIGDGAYYSFADHGLL